MPICIGGRKHGQFMPGHGYFLEFEIMPRLSISPARDIPVPMNAVQRIIAKLARIPTSIPRPIQRVEPIREVYQLHEYGFRGERIQAYVLEGIDPGSQQTIREIQVLSEGVRCDSGKSN